MRIARKLLLLAGLVIAVMACTAITASAQETEIEVVWEATGAPCDPCNVHSVGESHLYDTVNMVIVSTCQDELEGVVFHDGTGYGEWTGTNHGPPGCNLTNCQSATTGPDGYGEGEWPVSGAGELGGGAGHATIRLCLRNPTSGSELHCDAEDILEDGIGDPHEADAFMTALCAGGARRIESYMASESSAHDQIEFIHHDDSAP